MYCDSQNQLWSAAALTATGVSTNCIDQEPNGTTFGVATGVVSSNSIVPDYSRGEPLALDITIGVAASSGGTQTYEFQVITATATDLTTGQLLVVTTGTIATASAATWLALGQHVIVPIPPASFALRQRYLGAKFVGANSPTVTVTAYVRPMSTLQDEAYYATAIVIK